MVWLWASAKVWSTDLLLAFRAIWEAPSHLSPSEDRRNNENRKRTDTG